jgi:hypothetical protein
MRNTFLQRLARLEAEAGVGALSPPHLFLCFTDRKVPNPHRAESNGREWHQAPSESAEHFSKRVAADLVPGRPSLVFFFDEEPAH